MQLSAGALEAVRQPLGLDGALLEQSSALRGFIKIAGGLCLSTEDRRSNRGKVMMAACDRGNLNEDWTHNRITGQIKSSHGICLDAAQRGINRGKVHMWACEDGNPNQEWTYDAQTGRIRNRHGICLDAHSRNSAGSEVHMWQCLAGEPNQRWMFMSFATPVPTPAPSSGSCRTALHGEACYAHIDWAMKHGLSSNPQSYPGLTRSSTFEEFQALFYSRGMKGGVCATPPCMGRLPAARLPATTTAAPVRIPSACTAISQRTAQDGWSTGTCESRITYSQSIAGGSLSLQEALEKVAIEYPACSACWPWKRYKASHDTRVSRKRGIAIQNTMLSQAALQSLASAVSWGKVWDDAPDEGGPDLAAWSSAGVRFVPMVWGSRDIAKLEASGLPRGSSALLGFNEPNFANQANLSPQQAASLWPRVQQLAAAAGIHTLVSPAVGFSTSYDPVQWLRDFMAACRGCKVDAVAFHSYTCYGKWLKEHLDKFRVFGKPIWITEMACSDPQSPERLSMDGQMAYMREAVPLLERDPDVQMYAWFSYFKDQWRFPIVAGSNGDAGLVHADGSLSRLGQLYASFATTQPMERASSSRRSGKAVVAPAADSAQWLPVDGGVDRACRGASWTDNSDTYYQVHLGTASMAACKALCKQASVCKGVEYSSPMRRCEVWKRPSGIGSTWPAPGFTCLRYQATCRTAVTGEACYTAAAWAKRIGVTIRPEWYPGLSSASSFKDFQARLYSTGAGNGVCSQPPC